eukprot:1159290-Pelagomonas_calceolata.AAC.3
MKLSQVPRSKRSKAASASDRQRAAMPVLPISDCAHNWVPVKRDIRCEHGRSAQEAIRMGCKSPRSAIKE